MLYNAGSLVDYILKTGDFTEPETRLEFSDAELRALDAVAAEAGLGKPSVLEAKQHPETYAERRTRRDAVVGVERCAGEVVSEMLAVVEQCEPEEGEMCLVMNLFPSFSDLYRQMADVDAEYSRQCIDHYRAFLRGPPNRPTRDRHGFLSTVITFLEQARARPLRAPASLPPVPALPRLARGRARGRARARSELGSDGACARGRAGRERLDARARVWLLKLSRPRGARGAAAGHIVPSRARATAPAV